MSQSNSLMFTVGVPIWHLRLETESFVKSEKKEHIRRNFKKCPNDEIWEMANVYNKGSGMSSKAWVTQNHVGDITGKKVRGEGAFLSGKSMKSPQCYGGTFFWVLDKDWLPDMPCFLLHHTLLTAQIKHRTNFPFAHAPDIIFSLSHGPSSKNSFRNKMS